MDPRVKPEDDSRVRGGFRNILAITPFRHSGPRAGIHVYGGLSRLET